MIEFKSAAELFQDRALELPPLSERLARQMIESLRSWPLLRGYRGRPPANIDRLIEVQQRHKDGFTTWSENSSLQLQRPVFLNQVRIGLHPVDICRRESTLNT